MLDDYEAAIDRLDAVLRACPDDRLSTPCWEVKRSDAWMPRDRSDDELQEFSAFWATAAHAIFFLDYYLDSPTSAYDSPYAHFDAGLDDKMQALLPNPPIGRDELLAALEHGRAKARRVLPALTDDELATPMPVGHPHAGETFGQLLRGNLAHMREHAEHLEAVVTS